MLVLRSHSLPDELAQRVKAYLTYQHEFGSSSDLSILTQLPEGLRGDLMMHIVGKCLAKNHLFQEAAQVDGFIGMLSTKLKMTVFMMNLVA